MTSPKRKRWGFDLSDLGFLYGVLFALSLVLINPWGEPRGPIWTAPKVYVIIGLTLLTWAVVLFNLVRFFWERTRRRDVEDTFALPPGWGIAAFLWLCFLASGLVAVLLSPVSFHVALTPQNEMGDGWVYWAWMAAFTLGNALLLKRYPTLFRPQLYGLLAGGILTSAAVFVQAYNWKLDFTATMGETFDAWPDTWLKSLIHVGQMPIGFMSNRGHTAFVIAALAVLTLVCLMRGWLRARYAWPLYTVFLVAIYLTSTRGAQLAFAVGLLYLLVRFWRLPAGRKTVLVAAAPLVLGVALVLLQGAGTRNLPSFQTLFTNLDGFTSARSYLWPTAVDGIRERPLFGWGFNGYGIAWPRIANFEERYKIYLAKDRQGNAIEMERLIRADHYTFVYRGVDGEVHRGRILTNKAHNIILDTAVSVGLVGLAIYLLLFGFFLYATARGAGWGLEALAVVYFVFGLTWFESAQYSHVAWWALSVGFALSALPQGRSARETPGDGALSPAKT